MLVVGPRMMPPDRPPGTLVVGSPPFWNLTEGPNVVLANRGSFNEVSPWIYGIARNGEIVAQVPERAAETAAVWISFNMTFEIYQQRLGKDAFTLDAVAVTQDPDNLRDYVRQTKRWMLGLWQTVRRHPPRRSLFTAMLTLLLLELLTSSLFFVLLPLLVVVLAVPAVYSGVLTWPGVAPVYDTVTAHLSLQVLLFGVVGAAIALYGLPLAWLRSTGRWTSPARRLVGARPQLGELVSMSAAGASD